MSAPAEIAHDSQVNLDKMLEIRGPKYLYTAHKLFVNKIKGDAADIPRI